MYVGHTRCLLPQAVFINQQYQLAWSHLGYYYLVHGTIQRSAHLFHDDEKICPYRKRKGAMIKNMKDEDTVTAILMYSFGPVSVIKQLFPPTVSPMTNMPGNTNKWALCWYILRFISIFLLFCIRLQPYLKNADVVLGREERYEGGLLCWCLCYAR